MDASISIIMASFFTVIALSSAVVAPFPIVMASISGVVAFTALLISFLCSFDIVSVQFRHRSCAV